VIWGEDTIPYAVGARHALSRNMSSLIEHCKLASGAATCRQITRQSRWNLGRARAIEQYRTKPPEWWGKA
jgi:hypothetical protein